MYRQVLLLAFATGIACAADGTVDMSFGTAGNIVLAPADASLSAYAVAVQQDGKILVGGSRWAFGQDIALNQAVVWRFLPDGSADPAFGDAGLSVISSGSAIAFVWAVQPLSNGDILATAGPGFGVVRLHENGDVDMQFGDNGVAVVDFADLQIRNASAHALTVDHQGRILIAGGGTVIDDRINYWYAGAVARLLSSGQIDQDFGNSGRVVMQVGTAADGRSATFLGVQTDDIGRVFISGHVNVTAYSGINSFLAARLDEHGAFDPEFGSNGVVAANLSADSDDWGSNLILDHGLLLLGGISYAADANASMCILRLTENGMPDASYGSDGWAAVMLGSGSMRPGKLACQSDGKCLVLTSAPLPSSDPRQFVVSRVDAAGIVDATFGNSGIARVDVPASNGGGAIQARAIAIEGGRPVLVGTTDGVPSVNALFATRLENDLVFNAHFD